MSGWLDNLKRQSFYGSYQDAARRRGALPTPEEIAANDGDRWYGYEGPVAGDEYDKALQAQQGQAVAGGIVAGLTGATTLLSNAFKDAQIQDTSLQEGMISDLYNAGHQNYNNYDQLANDYAQLRSDPRFNYRDIRGMSDGQQVGSVLSSTASGAMTGLQIGGPWGALIGGVVGLGTGLGGVFTGNAAAKMKQHSLNVQAGIASDVARQNFAAAHERIGDNTHRQNVVNAVAKGGPIRRQSVKEYANKVLSSKPKMREHDRFSGIRRIEGDGGLTIRFKK